MHSDSPLHPIGNDKAPTFLGMAVIKGYGQMLLSDITRVKGYRRTQFKAWLTRRSDDPCSNLSGRPTSSHLMTTHYIREGEHRARASNSNRGATAKI